VFSEIFGNLNLKSVGVDLLRALYFDILGLFKLVGTLLNLALLEQISLLFYPRQRFWWKLIFLKVVEGEKL